MCTDGYGHASFRKGPKAEMIKFWCSGALLVHGEKPGSKMYNLINPADRPKARTFSSLKLSSLF
jgi:hypothetical protein